MGVPMASLINSNKIPLDIRLHFSAWRYCLVSSSASQGTEYLKLYSSVSYILLELKKYAFSCTLTLGRCLVPGDMGVVLVL